MKSAHREPDREPPKDEPSTSDLSAVEPSDGDSQDEELFHFLLENIPDRIYFKDTQSRFIRISRTMAEFHRIKDPSEMIGKTDFDVFSEEHARPAFDDEQRIMATGKPIEGKVEKETLPDGRVRWCFTTKMALRNRKGEIIGTCGISKDFTELRAMEERLQQTNEDLAARTSQLESALADLNNAHMELKAAQEQLIEAEKAQSIARLAFGIAHEIRNPLNTLNMGLHYLSAEPVVVNALKDSGILDEMMRSIGRAEAVVGELMESTSTAPFSFVATPVRPVIERVLENLDHEFRGNGIEVKASFDPDLPPLGLDIPKIERVLVSIILNAVQSMDAGGRLEISVRENRVAESAHDPGLRTVRRLRGGDRVVEIVIDDTGKGISKDALDHAFDAFFTTKSTGEGTGLGLTVSQKIIELHGGTIDLTNRPEGGARVTIRLPAAQKSD